jgi:hypothetical protein
MVINRRSDLMSRSAVGPSMSSFTNIPRGRQMIWLDSLSLTFVKLLVIQESQHANDRETSKNRQLPWPSFCRKRLPIRCGYRKVIRCT